MTTTTNRAEQEHQSELNISAIVNCDSYVRAHVRDTLWQLLTCVCVSVCGVAALDATRRSHGSGKVDLIRAAYFLSLPRTVNFVTRVNFR